MAPTDCSFKKELRTVLCLFPAIFVLLHLHCIGAEKDGGFIIYPHLTGALGPAVFSHRAHGKQGARYKCDQCHQPASSHAPKLAADSVHLSLSCAACHDGQTRSPRGQAIAASIQDCPACHMPAADVVIKLNRMDPVAFSHIRHIGADTEKKGSKRSGFSCGDCHPEPFERKSTGLVGMEIPHENGGCAQCHNGKKRQDGMPPAFAADTRCLSCHVHQSAASS